MTSTEMDAMLKSIRVKREGCRLLISGRAIIDGKLAGFMVTRKIPSEQTPKVQPIPCPCCGGVSAPGHGSNGFYYVQCGNCGLMTSNFDTKAEAIAAWNRRVK